MNVSQKSKVELIKETDVQIIAVDLKSNIFWAIASIALITLAMLMEPGPTAPMMAGYTETADASTG